ncbi:MAG: Glu-tRNA(Gln) amidotransferase GatDE subunit D, partial [Candidatus Korarchaeum sp.]
GHVPKHVIPEVRELVRDGVPVVISSQCLFGRVDLKVYETGRRLLEAGAIPAMDMLPEVSLVKLMFVLGHTQELEEIRRLMLTNLAGEIGSRIPINTFPPCWR